jgi:hypothetical protein
MGEDPSIATALKDLRTESIKAAIEWSKQITALSTGTIIISGTFIKDILGGDISYKVLIIASWLALFASTILGVLFLATICAILSTGNVNELDIYSRPSKEIAIFHIIFFFVGVAAFIIFVAINL